MIAPKQELTEKAKQKIASKQAFSDKINGSKESPLVKIDVQTLLERMLNDENVQKEIEAEAIKKLDTKESVDAVKAILGEYLDSYMILGYGIDGSRIILKKTKTNRDEDSIIEMLRCVFMSMIQG